MCARAVPVLIKLVLARLREHYKKPPPRLGILLPLPLRFAGHAGVRRPVSHGRRPEPRVPRRHRGPLRRPLHPGQEPGAPPDVRLGLPLAPRGARPPGAGHPPPPGPPRRRLDGGKRRPAGLPGRLALRGDQLPRRELRPARRRLHFCTAANNEPGRGRAENIAMSELCCFEGIIPLVPTAVPPPPRPTAAQVSFVRGTAGGVWLYIFRRFASSLEEPQLFTGATARPGAQFDSSSRWLLQHILPVSEGTWHVFF